MNARSALLPASTLEVSGIKCVQRFPGPTRPPGTTRMFGVCGLNPSASTLASEGIDLGIAYAIPGRARRAAHRPDRIVRLAEPATLDAISLARVVGLSVGVSH
jgi:hypothetical protein